MPKTERRSFSREFKLKIIERLEAGEAGASGRSTRLTVRHRGVDAAIICRN